MKVVLVVNIGIHGIVDCGQWPWTGLLLKIQTLMTVRDSRAHKYNLEENKDTLKATLWTQVNRLEILNINITF